MRRTAPTGSLSSKLIKHFAVATVALTGLLAIFASDADWCSQSQTRSAKTNNQLAATGTVQLETEPLAGRLKVRPGPGGGSFEPDPSYDFGDGGGNSASPPAPQQTVRSFDGHSAPPLGLADAPDTTMIVDGGPSPAEDPLLNKTKIRAKSAPTAQQSADITANSARRSGQPGELD